MVAAFDIGNTNIHVGLYAEARLRKWSASGSVDDKIAHFLSRFMKGKNISGAAIASVVPKRTKIIKDFLKSQYRIAPVLVTAGSGCGLKLAYCDRSTLGGDRIANMVGGLARYNKDLLIISFGTATTLDIVLKERRHLGGIIAPGMDMLGYALSRRTALLKKVELRRPRRYLGKSTQACIRSGIVNGYIAMVRGLIKGIRREYGKRLFCLATGGWAGSMSRYLGEIEHYDQDLTTFGVYNIFEAHVQD
jgi:type III pantothenate kinase